MFPISQFTMTVTASRESTCYAQRRADPSDDHSAVTIFNYKKNRTSYNAGKM